MKDNADQNGVFCCRLDVGPRGTGWRSRARAGMRTLRIQPNRAAGPPVRADEDLRNGGLGAYLIYLAKNGILRI